MGVEIEVSDCTCIVTPSGRIDSITSVEFENSMREALELSSVIEIDLRETEYISSSGLRVLLKVKKELGEDGSLTLTHVGEQIMEVLDMTGFTEMLDVEEEGEPDASDIKVMFFDIDGTLLPMESKEVPESTKCAIAAAREHGIKSVIATGRDIVELEKLPIMDIDFDGYLTLNGNICLDQDKKMFAGNAIDPGEVEILVSIFKAGRIPFVLINDEGRYINFVDDVVRKTQAETNGTIPEVGEYHGEAIYQCLSFVDGGVRQKLEDLLDDCIITSWNDTGIDIIAKTGGKAAGLQKYLDKYGLKRSECMAFGDGENDIPMIKFAGVGVAMGNAKEELKAAADHVTTAASEDGIENALKYFGLI